MPKKNTYITATDQFCGAGGSTSGAKAAGVEVRLALNHWKLAIETHRDLAAALKALKGYVIVSGYPCGEYSEWYESAGWQAYSIQAVTGAATPGKSVRTEVVWLNPRAAASQKQLQLFTTQ